MGHMSYRHFAAYNVVGALLWVLLFTYAGYLFGDLPVVQENLKLLIVAIIVLSVLPGVIELFATSGRRRNRRNKRRRLGREE
jgi:membrane-associated protein